MPRHQHKSRNINSQDNTSLPEPSNPTAVDPEKCNIADTQDLDFKKITIMNMFKDFKSI